MMNLKELKELLKDLPDNLPVETGNATGYMSKEKLESEKRFNIYSAGFYPEDYERERRKDKNKLEKIVIWGDE